MQFTDNLQFVTNRGGTVQRYSVRENGLGSQIAQTNAVGQTSGRAEYDAFGVNKWYQNGGWNAGNLGTFGFAGSVGYESDAKNPDFPMLGMRHYIPIPGRFLTQDPVGHEGGLNLYGYCDNNPSKYSRRCFNQGCISEQHWESIERNAVSSGGFFFYCCEKRKSDECNGDKLLNRSFLPLSLLRMASKH